VRTCRRSAGVLVALAALLVLAVPAEARTVVAKSGPYVHGSFETLRPKVIVRPPRVDGYITRMHARLVDAQGRHVRIQRVMLHHVVFINQGRFPGDRKPKCGARFGEPFYGTGEEDQRLDLPAGYGYRTRPKDVWKMQAMLMSHSVKRQKVFVEWTMEVTKRRLAPVTPYWVRVTNCRNEPSWSVPGGGGPGSIQLKTHEWNVPADGLIVAGGAHLHGGAHNITLRQPRCRGRRLMGSDPSYGMPDDVMYKVRPFLHEPGPMNTAWFTSRSGIAIHRGDVLRATAAYDNEHPHMGVMGVWHIYVAEGAAAARRARATDRCAPLPADAREQGTDMPHRPSPPVVRVPLTTLKNGVPTDIDHPKGKVHFYGEDARPLVRVTSIFRPVRMSVPAGTTVTWRFQDVIPHKVSLANGPRAMGSPTLMGGRRYRRRFTVPGTYQMFCYLHPMTMHQELIVRPSGVAPDPGEGSEAVGEEQPND